jgi:hypothetical protein
MPSRVNLKARAALPFVLIAGGAFTTYNVLKYTHSSKEDGSKKVRGHMAGVIVGGAAAAGLPHPIDASKIRGQAARKGHTPMPTTVRNCWQGVGMACGAQVARLGMTSALKAGSSKAIDESGSIPEAWKPTAKKASIFAAAGLAELSVHVPTAMKNLQILDSSGKSVVEIAKSRPASSFFSRGTGAAITRKTISQGILFAFKEDMDKTVNSLFPSLSKAQTTSVSSFLLGCFGETVTNFIDRVRVLRQQDLGITKTDAIVESLKEPFKGALKASFKKGISRSIYMTALQVVVENWDKIEATIDKTLSDPDVLGAINAFTENSGETMSPHDEGLSTEDIRVTVALSRRDKD